jgi:type IV secretory pathway ATPase VirB11/archaellum biosynthesis ATPase
VPFVELNEIKNRLLPSPASSSFASAIHGAHEHNLKNLSLVIPRDKFVVITGVIGSGKRTYPERYPPCGRRHRSN